MARKYVRADPSVRFWAWVEKSGPDECWIWKGTKDRNGYGRFNIRNGINPMLSHRFAWMDLHGRLPNDCLLHKCDNPSCVNPAHLFEGDRMDNVNDMMAKGRMPRGEKRGHAKLDREKVVAILCMLIAGKSSNSLSKLYGVTPNVIYGIKSGKRWKHIPRA